MCGRYSIAVQPEQLAAHFNASLPTAGLRARQNAAPTQYLPVLLNDGTRQIQLLRWGLVPSWASDTSMAGRLINARAETIHEKPSFREAFKRRRCLVLADGFYEWQTAPEGTKQPIRFARPDGAPFAFAGLWETWAKGPGAPLQTFTIITTTPNAVIAPIHDRMPVILSREGESAWLDNDLHPADWAALLVPCPPEGLTLSAANPATLRDFEA